MQKASRLLSTVIIFVLATQSWPENMDRRTVSAQEMVKASGIKGGLVVHVGNGDGTVTADFFANDRYVVHGLYDTRGNVDDVRQSVGPTLGSKLPTLCGQYGKSPGC